MTTTTEEKENNKESLIIYSIIFLGVVVTDFFLYKKEIEEHLDLFSISMGLVGWFGFLMHSQKIITKNLFRLFTYIGIAIFTLCIIKQLLIGFILFPLLTSTLPLIFVGYFRLLTYLFYKDYPQTEPKPIIVFGSKYGTAHFDGDDEDYVPTMKEKTFSLLLFMGFMAFIFGVVFLLKAAHIILT